MNKLLTYLAIASIVFCLPVSVSAQKVQSRSHAASQISAAASNEQSIREVQAVFDRYIDGWKRADIEELSHVYANDARVTGIWPDPTLTYPVQGWAEIRRELERVFGYAKGMNMAYSPRHVEIYGNVAIMTTNWEWVDPGESDPAKKTGDDDKTSAERRSLMRDEGFGKGQATFVFFHRDNRWVLVHEHASVLPEDK